MIRVLIAEDMHLIRGVVERARAVSGSASAEAEGDGRFRLTVAVPEVAA